jgi:hypothetical protein
VWPNECVRLTSQGPKTADNGLPIIPANGVNLINILAEQARADRFIDKNGLAASMLFSKSCHGEIEMHLLPFGAGTMNPPRLRTPSGLEQTLPCLA